MTKTDIRAHHRPVVRPKARSQDVVVISDVRVKRVTTWHPQVVSELFLREEAMAPRTRSKPPENHIDTSPDAFGLVTELVIAAMLGRDVRTLQRWQSERSGPPFILVGSERRYHPEHVKQWLLAREQQPRTSRRVGRGQ